MAFELDTGTAAEWAVSHGLVAGGAPIEVEELAGGVSASVIAVRAPSAGTAVVLKQALARLRVTDDWRADQGRTETEAEAMSLCGELTPGAVPRVLATDPATHVIAIELIEGCANWQAEVAAGRVHADLSAWAGGVLGTWHARTSTRLDELARFAVSESFEEQRLRPFHETVMRRLPELAPLIAPRVRELRETRRCLVHGDYAMKNILVGEAERRVLDFEVAHLGHPVFDLAFFLSFVTLSSIRWVELGSELRSLASGFLDAYRGATATLPGIADEELTAHTACLILARTDGTSPAQFLDRRSRAEARTLGRELLLHPSRGLWG